jgi:hypothetical protein
MIYFMRKVCRLLAMFIGAQLELKFSLNCVPGTVSQEGNIWRAEGYLGPQFCWDRR